MELRCLYEAYKFIDDKYTAYHVTDSFHIVKKIFNEGFKTQAGIDRVCLSDKPWDNMGFYIVEAIATRDQHFNDSPETGVCPTNAKPIRWGLIFNRDDIIWIKEHPNDFDFNKYDDIVNKKANNWQKNEWEYDKIATNSDKRALDAILGRGYAYDTTPKNINAEKIVLGLLRKHKDLVDAYRNSKMTIPQFKDHLVRLIDSNTFSWDELKT